MILCLGAPLIIDGSRTSPSKISWVSCVNVWRGSRETKFFSYEWPRLITDHAHVMLSPCKMWDCPSPQYLDYAACNREDSVVSLLPDLWPCLLSLVT